MADKFNLEPLPQTSSVIPTALPDAPVITEYKWRPKVVSFPPFPDIDAMFRSMTDGSESSTKRGSDQSAAEPAGDASVRPGGGFDWRHPIASAAAIVTGAGAKPDDDDDKPSER